MARARGARPREHLDGRDRQPEDGRPIGSGPFLVERWERGKQLTLVRNPRYWGPHPAYLDRLVLRFHVRASHPVEAFRRGELDIAWAFPAGLALRRAPAGAASGSSMHRSARLGALRDPGRPRRPSGAEEQARPPGARLRHRPRGARSRGLRRDRPERIPARQRRLPRVRARHYRPNWSGYRYRPAEARRLLEQAGCRRGCRRHLRLRGRTALASLRDDVVPGISHRAADLELVQAQLRQVGIEVVPTFAPPPAFFGQILPGGGLDVALFVDVVRAEPAARRRFRLRRSSNSPATASGW